MELNLSIEVNEEQFADLCQNTLENLPEDKLQEILLKSIEASLVVDKEKTGYGYGSRMGILIDGEMRPTQLMQNILKKANFEKYFEPIAQKIVSFVEENYEQIVRDAVASAFSTVLFSREYQFNLQQCFADMIRRNYK